MQNHALKIILFIFFHSIVTPTLAQNQYRLDRADSLFHQKRYTQSFEIYRSMFEQGLYSPSMLLKMAFVQEGLNHTASALYYLNLYYEITLDESVAAKIEELADKHRLSGYKFDEQARAYLLYAKNELPITVGLGATSLFFLALMVYFRRRGGRPVGSFICLVLTLLLTIAHVNHFGVRPSAIIASSNTYIMAGPSAGASVVGVADEGHKVSIAHKNDVWVKVRWNGRDAYIKQDRLLPLDL